MTWPVYVINMEKDTIRWGNVVSQLSRLGIQHERVEAVNGAHLTQEETDAVYRYRWWKSPHDLVPSEIGCYLSHLRIWQRLVDSGDDGVFIFEDDFVITDDMPKILDALSINHDGWDMVKLYTPHWGPGAHSINSRVLVDAYVVEHLINIPWCTLGYSLTQEGARRLLNKYPPFSRPVDDDIRRFWESKIRIASVLPPPMLAGDEFAVDGSIKEHQILRTSGHRASRLEKSRERFIRLCYTVQRHIALKGESVDWRKLMRDVKRSWIHMTQPESDNYDTQLSKIDVGIAILNRFRWCPDLVKQTRILMELSPTETHRIIIDDLIQNIKEKKHIRSRRIMQHLRICPDLRTPKLVSHQYRFVWVQVPGVASASILASITEADPLVESTEDSMDELYSSRPELHDYFSFAFIEHPRTRILPCYNDKIAGAATNEFKRETYVWPYHGLHPRMNFDAFCEWLTTPYGSDTFSERHWLSQIRQIELPNGELPDFVGRFENLDEDWDYVASVTGLPHCLTYARNPTSIMERRRNIRRRRCILLITGTRTT